MSRWARNACGASCGRRAFLAEASGLAIAAGLGACGGGGATDPPVGPQTVFSFAKNDKLSTVGGSIVTEVISQGRNVLLIIARTGQSSAVALSATCTHTGCAVAYDGASAFRCPCHGSTYSRAGVRVFGPAPRAKAPMSGKRASSAGKVSARGMYSPKTRRKILS